MQVLIGLPPSLANIIKLSHDKRGLSHTYTRLPVTLGTKDSHNRTAYLYTTPSESGLPCRYSASDELTIAGDSRVTVSRPTLSLPFNSELVINDKVTDIMSSEGELLIVGTLIVDSIETVAHLGPLLQKIAILRIGDPR